jgi:hypothetical protein
MLKRETSAKKPSALALVRTAEQINRLQNVRGFMDTVSYPRPVSSRSLRSIASSDSRGQLGKVDGTAKGTVRRAPSAKRPSSRPSSTIPKIVSEAKPAEAWVSSTEVEAKVSKAAGEESLRRIDIAFHNVKSALGSHSRSSAVRSS